MAQFILKVPLKKYLLLKSNMLLFKFIEKSKKLLLAVCFLLASEFSFAKGMPQEYYEISDNIKSKKYFFDFMYKMIEKENIKVLEERRFVKEMLTSNILEMDFNSPKFKKLLEIKEKYNIENLYTFTEYSRKIDIVPPAQALAQAAVESGWGKSRFIKVANNIFGHWTYNPRIGILPEDRVIGATHYIRKFQSLQDSISAYILNLNRNPAYKTFRKKRYELRLSRKNPDGLTLSQTMLNYSGIAHEYLTILRSVIVKNQLKKYDSNFYTNLNTNLNTH